MYFNPHYAFDRNGKSETVIDEDGGSVTSSNQTTTFGTQPATQYTLQPEDELVVNIRPQDVQGLEDRGKGAEVVKVESGIGTGFETNETAKKKSKKKRNKREGRRQSGIKEV